MTTNAITDAEEKRVGIFNAIKNAIDVETAVHIFRDAYPIAHVSYHMNQSVAGEIVFDTPYVKTTYSPAWVGQYLIKGYITVDPVINEGKMRALPFNWTELEPVEAAIELFTEFQAQGHSPQGFTIPIVDKVGRRGLLSLNARVDCKNWEEIIAEHTEDWVELGYTLHKRAIFELFGDKDPAPTLSPRELETLHWTALGKDYKDIAAILNISENTIRTYMRAIRYKLDCSTLTQAVAKAIKLKLIDP